MFTSVVRDTVRSEFKAGYLEPNEGTPSPVEGRAGQDFRFQVHRSWVELHGMLLLCGRLL